MSKANSIRIKPVELELNGEKYLLKYDFNALIELEDIYGSIEDSIEAMSGKKVFDEKGEPVMVKSEDDGKEVQKRKFAIRPVRDFLWAGLLAYRKTITKEEVANLLNFADFQFIIEKLTEALNAAMPVVKTEDDVKN
jgi:hypothetical protein